MCAHGHKLNLLSNEERDKFSTGGMNKNALIVVLLCFCLSYGNGDERIHEARRSLQSRYAQLAYYVRDRDGQYSQSILFRHVRELQDQEKKWRNWVKETSGYSAEQLSNPPASMNVNELKLATEYHLWQSGWYHVRFITLNKAGKRRRRSKKDQYPNAYKCRVLASKARDLSETHKNLYLKYFQALGEKAKEDIIREIEFPNHIPSQELQHGYERNDDSECQNDKSSESYALFKVKTKLAMLINVMLEKKMTIVSGPVYKKSTISTFTLPSGMKMKLEILSKLPNSFPVKNLFKPPNEASRSDKEFLEVAWLFNRYRSLWYKNRHDEFLKFLRHRKEDLKAELLEQVEAAIEIAYKNFLKYESLYNDYHKVFLKYHEQIPKKATLREKASTEAHELDETVGSNSLELCTSRAQPELDLNVIPPVIENEREHLELDLNAALLETDETEEDAFEMEPLAPKRFKVTPSEENHFQSSLDLNHVHQSPSKKSYSESSRTGENSYSSCKIQLYHFF